MAKRSEVFHDDSLGGLYVNHPYLLLFQKEDWKDYIVLLANIYDLIEEDNTRVPYEVVKALAIKFFSQKKIVNLDQKVLAFFSMSIGELKILKDSHDHFGQRFVETTRFGKDLLQLVENWLSQRTRFSGTGAETLLGALNNILLTRHQMTTEQALAHHRQKIKNYQDDIQKIKNKGLQFAELLPIPHSNEALFSQAEESAVHILSSVEDVKIAIEKQRQELAQGYFKASKSAGQNLNAVVEFYENMHNSSEYISYTQAKNLLSFLDGLSSRFTHKNIDHIVHHIQSNELIDKNLVQRSQLRGFSSQFQSADHSIQEKIKSQLRLLQQQVTYAMTQDVQGVQRLLRELLALAFAKKAEASDYFSTSPYSVEIPVEFALGDVQLFHFQVNKDIQSSSIEIMALNETEQRALFEALLAAEEATLQVVIEKLMSELERKNEISLSQYEITLGLAEYYVLSEIELFQTGIHKTFEKHSDVLINGKFGSFMLMNSPTYILSLSSLPNGKQNSEKNETETKWN